MSDHEPTVPNEPIVPNDPTEPTTANESTVANEPTAPGPGSTRRRPSRNAVLTAVAGVAVGLLVGVAASQLIDEHHGPGGEGRGTQQNGAHEERQEGRGHDDRQPDWGGAPSGAQGSNGSPRGNANGPANGRSGGS